MLPLPAEPASQQLYFNTAAKSGLRSACICSFLINPFAFANVPLLPTGFCLPLLPTGFRLLLLPTGFCLLLLPSGFCFRAVDRFSRTAAAAPPAQAAQILKNK
ncbi:hypothetical protein [Methanimicrococcus hongohii]|uniref:hypothetical protein n=1 Tax=Methanimicrococcus hongohii TaxID=3028295 RepID=UPI002930CDEC|nr:hypothetical protein [Methanimicrococcus sp. Hf6]